MVMQLKVWIMTILFDKWISHFITYFQAYKDNFFTMNFHLLIFYEHNSHVIVNITQKPRGVGVGVGIDYFTIPHKPCIETT